MAFKCVHCSAPVWPLRDDADFLRDHCTEVTRLRAAVETAERVIDSVRGYFENDSQEADDLLAEWDAIEHRKGADDGE